MKESEKIAQWLDEFSKIHGIKADVWYDITNDITHTYKQYNKLVKTINEKIKKLLPELKKASKEYDLFMERYNAVKIARNRIALDYHLATFLWKKDSIYTKLLLLKELQSLLKENEK